MSLAGMRRMSIGKPHSSRVPTKSHFMWVRPRLRRASPSHGPVLLAPPALPPWAPPSPPRRYGRRAREGNSLWIHHSPPIGNGFPSPSRRLRQRRQQHRACRRRACPERSEWMPERRMRPERCEQDARTYPSDGWGTPGLIEHELDFVGALHTPYAGGFKVGRRAGYRLVAPPRCRAARRDLAAVSAGHAAHSTAGLRATGLRPARLRNAQGQGAAGLPDCRAGRVSRARTPSPGAAATPARGCCG
jgi:hypothetical protein